MSSPDSQTIDSWIRRLHEGDSAGANVLWNRYYDRLIRLACRRLQGSKQRMVDEEDVVNSAFNSFFRAIKENRTPDLKSEDEIWRLLVTLTARKAIKALRHENRGKRRHELADAYEYSIEEIIGSEPTMEFTIAIIEQFRDLNERLVDEQMRAIVYRKMEGYTNAEIAQELNCSVRTIKRRMTIIRSLLTDKINEQDTFPNESGTT